MLTNDQWDQEEEQTDHDRQYTSHKPKKMQSNQLPLPSQTDHNARQDPLNTTIRQKQVKTRKKPNPYPTPPPPKKKQKEKKKKKKKKKQQQQQQKNNKKTKTKKKQKKKQQKNKTNNKKKKKKQKNSAASSHMAIQRRKNTRIIALRMDVNTNYYGFKLFSPESNLHPRFKCCKNTNELAYDKNYNKTCVTSKDTGQPVHPPSMVLVHPSFDSQYTAEGTYDQQRQISLYIHPVCQGFSFILLW